MTIDPGYVPAKRVLGARLVLSGRLAEAQFQYEAVLRIDPYYTSARWQLDVVYWLRGLWDKARANLRLQIEDGDEIGRDRYKLCQVDYFEDGDLPSFVTAVDSIDNNHSWLNFRRALLKRELKVAAALAGEGEFQGILIPALPGMGFGFSEELLKGLIQLELGDRAGAIEFADEALERLEPLQKSGSVEPRDLAYRAIGYALKRDRTSFERLLLEIRDLTETDNWRYRWRLHCEMLIAVSYLALEETDSAIETLEAASEIEGPMLFNRELELWFVFDKLHGNPRFDALLK